MGFFNYVQQEQKTYVNKFLLENHCAPTKLDCIYNIYNAMKAVPSKIMLACWNLCKIKSLHVNVNSDEAESELKQLPQLEKRFEDLAIESNAGESNGDESNGDSVLDIIQRFIDENDNEQNDSDDTDDGDSQSDESQSDEEESQGSIYTKKPIKQTTITNYFSQS